MAATQEVLVRLRAVGQRAFKRDMDDSAKSVAGVGSAAEGTAKKAGSSFKKWAAASGAVAAGGKVLKDSVTGAVDLGEQINKTAVVFRGPGAKSVIDWSKTTAKGIGTSRAEALEAAGTFGNMLIPMGFARGKAADMSKSMVQLGGDMASFNNASPSDTLEAIRSGLAGETEPLRKYGVFLNDARVKSEAMSLGLVKASKNQSAIKSATIGAQLAQQNYNDAVKKHGKNSQEAKRGYQGLLRASQALTKSQKGSIPQLTAAQKAQATYSLIMKDTKDAQGDFARTSDSLANKQRILKAQYADMTAALGQKLVPILQTLANHLNIVIPAVATMLGLWAAWKVATLAAAAANVIFGASMAAWPIFLIIAGVALLIAGFVLLYNKVGWFHDAVDAVFNWIKSHWPLLLAILTGPFGLAVLAIVKNFDKVKAAAGAAAHWIADRFRDVIDFFRRLPGAILSAIGSLGSKIKDALDPGGVVGKVGGFLGKVTGKQHGGITRPGETTLVGEAGPELLSLPGGSRITPLPALGGYGATTAHFYLDRRLIATAVAQADADQRARR